jgi:hypothetical protein
MNSIESSNQLENRATAPFARFTGVGLILTLLALAASAQTYDAARQFSIKINTDTSRWSYRYNNTGTRDGNYTLLTDVQPVDSTWYDNKGTQLKLYDWQKNPTSAPTIFANKRSSPIHTDYCCGPVVLPKWSIFEHPTTSMHLGDSVLSFLVPQAGTVTVKYRFTDIDPYGGNGIRWYVDLNSGANGDLYSGKLHSTPGHIRTTGTRTFQIQVAEGDRLNFIIDSNTNWNFDSTAVVAIVSY